jgi:hypothetical protein
MGLLAWAPSASCPTGRRKPNRESPAVPLPTSCLCFTAECFHLLSRIQRPVGEGFLRLTHQDSDEYNDLAAASLRGKMDSRNLWRPSFLA